MDKHFIVNNRCVSTDSTLLIADNGDYTAVFAIDQEWMGRDITARFLLPDGRYCDAGLSDSLTCIIPPEALTGSDVRVGIYSGEMATMPCRCQVSPSIKTGCNQQAEWPIQEIQPYTSTFAGVSNLVTSGKMELELPGNGSVACEFEGTGVLLQMYPCDANVYYQVYDAGKFELASYTYSRGIMLYARRKDGVAATEKPVKSAYVNYTPGPNDDREQVIEDGIIGLEYGNYLLLATKTTGADAIPIVGIKVLNEEEKESEEK